jgi:hypothetical protein
MSPRRAAAGALMFGGGGCATPSERRGLRRCLTVGDHPAAGAAASAFDRCPGRESPRGNLLGRPFHPAPDSTAGVPAGVEFTGPRPSARPR